MSLRDSSMVSIEELQASQLPPLKYFLLEREELAEDNISSYPIFDDSLLSSAQIPARNILELHDLISHRGVPDYPVIFCLLPRSAGITHLEGEIGYPLVFIDTTRLDSSEDFRKLYLHEAAHLWSNGQDHDFVFSVALNVLLMKSGYPPTDEEYDYSGCFFEEIMPDEVKEHSVFVADSIIKANLPEHLEHRAVQYAVTMSMLLESSRTWDEVAAGFKHVLDEFGQLADS